MLLLTLRRSCLPLYNHTLPPSSFSARWTTNTTEAFSYTATLIPLHLCSWPRSKAYQSNTGASTDTA